MCVFRCVCVCMCMHVCVCFYVYHILYIIIEYIEKIFMYIKYVIEFIISKGIIQM